MKQLMTAILALGTFTGGTTLAQAQWTDPFVSIPAIAFPNETSRASTALSTNCDIRLVTCQKQKRADQYRKSNADRELTSDKK